MKRLRAVLFDFDGLILDTEWPEVVIWREIFVEHGHELPDEVWIAAIGRGAEQGAIRPAEVLAGYTGLPRDGLEAIYQSRRIAYILKQPLLPGVLDRMNEARDLGLRVVAVSSSDRFWVEGHLTRLGLWDRFERSFCADDVKNTKPNPELYLMALHWLGISSDEAVVFEDSPNGVAAAKAAGIPVIAVPNRLTAMLDLSAADVIVESLESVSLANLPL